MKRSTQYLNKTMAILQDKNLSKENATKKASYLLNRALASLDQEDDMDETLSRRSNAADDEVIVINEDLKNKIIELITINDKETEKTKKIFLDILNNIDKLIGQVPDAKELFSELKDIINELEEEEEEAEEEEEEKALPSMLAQALTSLKAQNPERARRIIANILEEEEKDNEYRMNGCEECDEKEKMSRRATSSDQEYRDLYEEVFSNADENTLAEAANTPDLPEYAYELIIKYSGNAGTKEKAEQQLGKEVYEEQVASKRSKASNEEQYRELWEHALSMPLSTQLEMAESNEVPPIALDVLATQAKDPGVREAAQSNPNYKGNVEKEEIVEEEIAAAKAAKKALAALNSGKIETAKSYLSIANAHLSK